MWMDASSSSSVMIGQYIEKDNKYWNHFLQLLNIMEYTFSPVVLPATPAYLQVIILKVI